jgi:translation initiation factor 5
LPARAPSPPLQAEKATVNGAHNAPDLQKLLNIFIDKFVLCPNCHLPETYLSVKKGVICHKCSACGARSPVDMSHKLCTFILKEAATAAAALKEEAAKERKEGKGEGGKKEKKDKKEKKEKKEKKHRKDKDGEEKAGAGAGSPAEDEDGEASSGDEGAAAAADKAAAVPAEEEDVDEDADFSDSSAAETVRLLLARSPAPSVEEIAAEVKKQQLNAGVPPTSRLALFLGAALGKESAVADIKAARTIKVLQALQAGKDAPAAGPAQALLLRALEAFVAVHKEALLKATPVLLQALYDADLVEEEAVVAWFSAKAKAGSDAAEVRARAAPFVEWLQTAEEEEEEDEDDE